MQLIEQIVHIEADSIRCISLGHMNDDYPLRLDGVLFASALVELGAQAAAAHASIHGMGGAHAGLVLALNDVELFANRVAEERLTVDAVLAGSMDGAAQYKFVVSGDERFVEGGLLLTMQMRKE